MHRYQHASIIFSNIYYRRITSRPVSLLCAKWKAIGKTCITQIHLKYANYAASKSCCTQIFQSSLVVPPPIHLNQFWNVLWLSQNPGASRNLSLWFGVFLLLLSSQITNNNRLALFCRHFNFLFFFFSSFNSPFHTEFFFRFNFIKVIGYERTKKKNKFG